MIVIENNDVMLTTIDNPYNPFTQFEEWYAYDLAKGYRTCELLGRYAMTSEGLSDVDNEEAINLAIEEIIRDLPIYKKVFKE